MNDKNETRKFYNRISQESFDEWFDNPALLPALSQFVKNLPDNPAVLDLGCGTGGESRRLVQLGARVTGIDFSEKSIQFARENVPEAEFILKNILEMDFPAASFDAVIEAGVLFHFNEKEQDMILGNIISILKPHGRFLSFCAEGDSEGMQEMDVNGEKYFRYSRRISVPAWTDQVIKRGFQSFSKYDFSLGPFRCVEFSLYPDTCR